MMKNGAHFKIFRYPENPAEAFDVSSGLGLDGLMSYESSACQLVSPSFASNNLIQRPNDDFQNYSMVSVLHKDSEQHSNRRRNSKTWNLAVRRMFSRRKIGYVDDLGASKNVRKARLVPMAHLAAAKSPNIRGNLQVDPRYLSTRGTSLRNTLPMVASPPKFIRIYSVTCLTHQNPSSPLLKVHFPFRKILAG